MGGENEFEGSLWVRVKANYIQIGCRGFDLEKLDMFKLDALTVLVRREVAAGNK